MVNLVIELTFPSEEALCVRFAIEGLRKKYPLKILEPIVNAALFWFQDHGYEDVQARAESDALFLTLDHFTYHPPKRGPNPIYNFLEQSFQDHRATGTTTYKFIGECERKGAAAFSRRLIALWKNTPPRKRVGVSAAGILLGAAFYAFAFAYQEPKKTAAPPVPRSWVAPGPQLPPGGGEEALFRTPIRDIVEATLGTQDVKRLSSDEDRNEVGELVLTAKERLAAARSKRTKLDDSFDLSKDNFDFETFRRIDPNALWGRDTLLTSRIIKEIVLERGPFDPALAADWDRLKYINDRLSLIPELSPSDNDAIIETVEAHLATSEFYASDKIRLQKVISKSDTVIKMTDAAQNVLDRVKAKILPALQAKKILTEKQPERL